MEDNMAVGDKEGSVRRRRSPLYCGRFFRMAFTSSATAVRANSNWSCRETEEEEGLSKRISHRFPL